MNFKQYLKENNKLDALKSFANRFDIEKVKPVNLWDLVLKDPSIKEGVFEFTATYPILKNYLKGVEPSIDKTKGGDTKIAWEITFTNGGKIYIASVLALSVDQMLENEILEWFVIGPEKISKDYSEHLEQTLPEQISESKLEGLKSFKMSQNFQFLSYKEWKERALEAKDDMSPTEFFIGGVSYEDMMDKMSDINPTPNSLDYQGDIDAYFDTDQAKADWYIEFNDGAFVHMYGFVTKEHDDDEDLTRNNFDLLEDEPTDWWVGVSPANKYQDVVSRLQTLLKL
jgi:hypothetical protein